MWDFIGIIIIAILAIEALKEVVSWFTNR